MSVDTVVANSVAGESLVGPGHKLEVRKPKECMEAVEMLAFGAPWREIREQTGLSYDNLSVLKERHGGAIEQRRIMAAQESEELASSYREVLRRKAEGLLNDEEALKRMNPKDAALTLGILTDKAMTLRGDATVVMEHKRGVGLEDVKQMILDAQKRIRGEAIDA